MYERKSHHRSEHALELGEYGEHQVADVLLERGYKIDFGPPGGCDLIIEDLVTVEVKTAMLSGRTDRNAKRWQFSLTKLDGCHRPFEEDLLILRCEDEPPVHFVIPGLVIPRDLLKIDITNSDPMAYEGKWAMFRELWEIVDLLVAWRHFAGHQTLEGG